MKLRTLRQLLREIIEEELYEEVEDLEEFSGVAALGGGPMMPLGVDATYPSGRNKRKTKKKVNEVNTVPIAFFSLTNFENSKVDNNVETNKFRDRGEMYEDSVECLARSFGGSKSPFKNQREVEKFLRQKVEQS
jgi:hypothetical protein